MCWDSIPRRTGWQFISSCLTVCSRAVHSIIRYKLHFHHRNFTLKREHTTGLLVYTNWSTKAVFEFDSWHKENNLRSFRHQLVHEEKMILNACSQGKGQTKLQAIQNVCTYHSSGLRRQPGSTEQLLSNCCNGWWWHSKNRKFSKSDTLLLGGVSLTVEYVLIHNPSNTKKLTSVVTLMQKWLNLVRHLATIHRLVLVQFSF